MPEIETPNFQPLSLIAVNKYLWLLWKGIISRKEKEQELPMLDPKLESLLRLLRMIFFLIYAIHGFSYSFLWVLHYLDLYNQGIAEFFLYLWFVSLSTFIYTHTSISMLTKLTYYLIIVVWKYELGCIYYYDNLVINETWMMRHNVWMIFSMLLIDNINSVFDMGFYIFNVILLIFSFSLFRHDLPKLPLQNLGNRHNRSLLTG